MPTPAPYIGELLSCIVAANENVLVCGCNNGQLHFFQRKSKLDVPIDCQNADNKMNDSASGQPTTAKIKKEVKGTILEREGGYHPLLESSTVLSTACSCTNNVMDCILRALAQVITS